MPTINVNDKSADFVSDKDAGILEAKRKIVFSEGRDLNLRDVTSVNLDGQWHRVTCADGSFYLVNPDRINYIKIN
ncbi:hypothetical protein EVB62_023 [Rhizobium phage RHph_TM33]|uniref:Uncharacterized protein n=1 Tax=Rhizobium phage RHph_TM33 TaxID=2509765 RepID=A0A7S5R5P0_9CAUD|nr:hypothetical protein EVB62_023 [Rhizobium phage RHph_TM33]QIG68481.1 hypothetical protein EVB63_022 [Rhizobium phage RHph_TM38]